MRVAKLVLIALPLALGCQGTAEDAPEEVDDAAGVGTVEPGPEPEPQRVVIEARTYAYQPSEITVTAGSPVWFIVTNAADMTHGFEVEGHGIEDEIAEIPGGATDSLSVTFEEPGEYEIYCPVGDHQARGMTGTLTVQ